jgi:hypothetical protein
MSYSKEFYEKCITCQRYNTNRIENGKGYYCEQHNCYYEPLDGCRSGFFGGYSENKYITDKEINSLIGRAKGSSGCFITTAICDILGYSDNCYYMETLRSFRENYLRTSEYRYLLKIYDDIGPKIVESMQNDSRKFDVAATLLTSFIIPACNYIEKNEYPLAIAKYLDMVEYLEDLYKVNSNVKETDDIEDSPRLGHGGSIQRTLINKKVKAYI